MPSKSSHDQLHSPREWRRESERSTVRGLCAPGPSLVRSITTGSVHGAKLWLAEQAIASPSYAQEKHLVWSTEMEPVPCAAYPQALPPQASGWQLVWR